MLKRLADLLYRVFYPVVESNVAKYLIHTKFNVRIRQFCLQVS